MVCLVVDLVAAAAFVPMRGTVSRPLFGPVMTERFDLHIRRIVATGTGVIRFPSDLGTRCRFCFVMLKIMAERFERLRRSCDVFLPAKHDLSVVGPHPFRFAFGGRRYDARDRAPGCSCSLLVATILTGTSKRCRCRRIIFPRPIGLAVLMTEGLAMLKNLFSSLAADRAALVVGCLSGTRCLRDEIPFFRVLHIDVLCKVAVLCAADLALCMSNARRGAAAVICLVVDLVAARALVPMRGAVCRPLYGPVMAKRGTIVRSRVGNIAAIALCSLRSILGTRCVIVRDVARKAVPKGFKRFRGGRDILFAAEQDLSGVSSQPFLFTFSGCRDFTRDRATRSSYGLYVTAAVRTSKFCRCGRISFPRPFGLAVTVAERVTKLKDLFPRFAADRAALVVGCLCCTRCRRDEILFLCILHIDVLCKFTVLNAADFALCKFDTRCGASAVVGLVVDLVAAGAFMPMRGAVRYPLFGPVMAERGSLVRSRVGNIAAIALRGLSSILGTRCVVVRNIARKAMPERGNLFIGRIIAILARFVWLPSGFGTGCILTEMRYRFVTECFYQYRAAFSTRLWCRTRCGCARCMARCGNLSIRRVFAAGTRFIVVPSCFSTRCGLTVMVFEIMAECRNC